MARIFSIFFDHEGSSQSAMISVRETALQTEYVLHLQQEPLQRQLPSNILIMDESGNVMFVHGHNLPPTLLMQSIQDAVQCHLNALRHQQC